LRMNGKNLAHRWTRMDTDKKNVFSPAMAVGGSLTICVLSVSICEPIRKGWGERLR